MEEEELLLRRASGLKGMAKRGWNTRSAVLVVGIEEGIDEGNEEGIVARIVEGNVEVVAEGVAG